MQSLHRYKRVLPLMLLFPLAPYLLGSGCAPPPGTDPGTTPPPNNGTDAPAPSSNGVPNPVFSSPVPNSTFSLGESLAITINANDPESNFSYELFYDQDGSLSGNEVSITTGTSGGSSVIQSLWFTANIPAGTYFVGVLVVDNAGQSASAFVGPITLVLGPTIQVTEPSESIAIEAGDQVTVRFRGSDPDGAATIDVFYDADNDFANGTTGFIGQGISESADNVTWDTTGLAEGTYFVGASIGHSGGNRIASYALGQIRIVGSDEADKSLIGLTLSVSEPALGVNADQGSTVQIKFLGRDTGNTATINLFYDTDTIFDNTPAPVEFASNLPLTDTSANWVIPTTLAPGIYFIGASIGRNSTDRLSAYAPGKVLVVASSGGGGGGGGGSGPIAVSFTLLQPTTALKIEAGASQSLQFTLNRPLASGTVAFDYALDNVAPFGTADGAWTPFATSIPSASSVVFNPAGDLPDGRYIIRGKFTATVGSNFSDSPTAVAPGSIEITSARDLVVTAPSVPQVINDFSFSGGVTFKFQVLNPISQDQNTLYVFQDANRLPGGETLISQVPNLTDTQHFVSSFTFPNSGLFFVGLSLGLNSGNRLFRHAPAPVWVWDDFSAPPFDGPPTDILTVVSPTSDLVLPFSDQDFPVTWFVNEVPPNAAAVKIFRENLNSNGNPAGSGTRVNLATGLSPTSSIASIDAGIPVGEYAVGVTYQRSPLPELTRYATGRLQIVPDGSFFIEVTSPVQNIFRRNGATNNTFAVNFQGIDPLNLATINVFIDKDLTFNQNEINLQTGLASTATTSTLNITGLTPGLYFIGASIGTSAQNRVAAYAPARLLIITANDPTPGLLTVLAPIAPSVAVQTGGSFGVRWFVSTPNNSSDTLTIFAEPDADSNGSPDGAATRIPVPPFNSTPYASIFSFDSGTAGLVVDTTYFVGVTYTPSGGSAVTRYAPGTVRVFGQFAWIGHVGKALRGAVFEGVNFNDNAGSSITPVKDIDEDGTDDFVLVSQFGKPGGLFGGVDNIDGAGFGEAYLIYGGSHLEGKRWKLNATGVQFANGLPGLVFTGIESQVSFNPNSGDRAGISHVIAVPDQDGDSAPELVFAVPQADSFRFSTLGKSGQFMRGGIVLVSSQDNFFKSRTQTWVNGTRLIFLPSVGDNFFSGDITPVLGNNNNWGCMALDIDGDGVPDDGNSNGQIGDAACADNTTTGCDDNCRFNSNGAQPDADGDKIGDACEPPTDTDSDGIFEDGDFSGVAGDNLCTGVNNVDCDDNCPFTSNTSQADSNNDGVGNACIPNPPDSDGDGILDDGDTSGTAGDNPCQGATTGCDDNCPFTPNPTQADADTDGVGDVCTSNFVAVPPPDSDGDGVPDQVDNCLTRNPGQSDLDNDGDGDACDSDIDDDGVANGSDNCTGVPNLVQNDLDSDGIGDLCDGDIDGDGVSNNGDILNGFFFFFLDNCPFTSNINQQDTDNDGIGDVCDHGAAPADPLADEDGDSIANGFDDCPFVYDPFQIDTDGDDVGDVCDNCPETDNTNQADANDNGVGTACESDFIAGTGFFKIDGLDTGDSDGDGVVDSGDNCPFIPNDQTDTDGDGLGDDCQVSGSDCGQSPPNQITVCANPNLNAPPRRADGCAEEKVDHQIGFYPELVEDDFSLGTGYPIWRNGNLYLPNGGFDTNPVCACPPITGPEDIQIKNLPVGGLRPSYTFGGGFLGVSLSSGFYTDISDSKEFGMRMLGEGMKDLFGWSLSTVDDFLLVGAPDHSVEEIHDAHSPELLTKLPKGKAYEIGMRHFRPGLPLMYGYKDRNTGAVEDRKPGPRPYQYIVGKTEGDPSLSQFFDIDGFGYQNGSCAGFTFRDCGDPFDPTFFIENSAPRTNEKIGYHVQGAADFNGDALGDVLIGAPDAFNSANSGDDSGAVYLIYRRDTLLDADRDLFAMEHATANDPSQLFGLMIRGRAGEHLGNTVGTGQDINGDAVPEKLDFNQDGRPDVVMGNQFHDEPGNTDAGEVIILFGAANLKNQNGGFRITNLLTQDLAVVLEGEDAGDLAGYNVGYAGDFDGDGKPDLLISAPGASATVKIGGADVTINKAGKVYLIFGSNDFTPNKAGNPSNNIYHLSDVGTTIKGLIFVGREDNDQIGGGELLPFDSADAANPNRLGTTGMRPRNIIWAGDINKDGFDDILLGAPRANAGEAADDQAGTEFHSGEVYLIFGFPAQ